jgi:hypothetical protein
VLRKILKAFGGQDILSASSLAQKVGVHESLLMQMLDELVRLGYLEENGNCISACDGCGHSTACGPNKAQRLWLMTEKGQKLIC